MRVHKCFVRVVWSRIWPFIAAPITTLHVCRNFISKVLSHCGKDSERVFQPHSEALAGNALLRDRNVFKFVDIRESFNDSREDEVFARYLPTSNLMSFTWFTAVSRFCLLAESCEKLFLGWQTRLSAHQMQLPIMNCRWVLAMYLSNYCWHWQYHLQ